MGQEVRLNEISSVLGEVEYPIETSSAADEFAAVTVLLADGEANLGELLSRTTSETFDSADDLEAELNNVLPREAVGEPYQSEGEG